MEMKTHDPAMATDLPFPRQYGTELLVISRGKGVWLQDIAGKKYLDFAGGIAVNALGYGRSDLAKVAAQQMRKLNHVSNLFTTEPALSLARLMLATGPYKFASVFFGNSGTEANEAALKYARLHSLRTKGPGHDRLLCFENGFHGRTFGALSCTPRQSTRSLSSRWCQVSPLRRTTTWMPSRGCWMITWQACIVEVLQGEGGLRTMTVEFARALNDGCRKAERILSRMKCKRAWHGRAHSMGPRAWASSRTSSRWQNPLPEACLSPPS